MPGLRERKKQETRKRISDVATDLFTQRGFAQVTVAEIAELANVSKMTVFNYFPRKEDLFFDREGEALAHARRAVVERPAGATPLDAMHALMRRWLSDSYPMVAVSPSVRKFWRTVEASPALRARGREMMDRSESHLAGLLADAAGLAAGDPSAALAAAMICAVQRVAYQVGMAALDAGDSAETIKRRQRDAIDRGFAQIAGGLAATPFGRARRKKAS